MASLGRWDEVGSELLRLTDQAGVEYCLGPVSGMLYKCTLSFKLYFFFINSRLMKSPLLSS